MDDIERATTKWALVVMVVLISITAFAATVITLLVRVNGLAEVNEELNRQAVEDVVAAVIFVRSCGDEGNTTEVSLTACVNRKLNR